MLIILLWLSVFNPVGLPPGLFHAIGYSGKDVFHCRRNDIHRLQLFACQLLSGRVKISKVHSIDLHWNYIHRAGDINSRAGKILCPRAVPWGCGGYTGPTRPEKGRKD